MLNNSYTNLPKNKQKNVENIYYQFIEMKIVKKKKIFNGELRKDTILCVLECVRYKH